MTLFKSRAIKLLLAVIILGALVAGGLAVRRKRLHHENRVEDAGLPPWAVRFEPVRQEPLATSFPVLATVLTSREQTISGQLQGEILEMGPREGQTVRKGDLLARIDTRELDQQILAQSAMLAAVGADLVNRKDQYARLKKAGATGAISESDVESAQTAMMAAENSAENLKRLIAALEVRRGYADIRAPADGTVAARLAEPGDLCTSAHPIYQLTVRHGARVRVSLPQRIHEQLQPGAPLVLDHGTKSMTIPLSRIFPVLDALAMGSAESDLETPPFGLASGGRLSARVILAKRDKALVVPQEAILRFASDRRKGTVFKLAPDPGNDAPAELVRAIPVTIDLDAAEGVAVLGELSAGDRVVVAQRTVLLSLHDGDPVNAFANER